MIRINLLGVPKPKKGKRAAVAAAPGEGGTSGMVLGVILLVIILGLNYGYYAFLGRAQAALNQDLAKEQKEGQRLQEVKVKFDQAQATKDNLNRRVCIINDLKAAQSGPVDLLTRISDTVNGTDGVWLKSMKDQGSTIELNGYSLSVHAVANFMANLQQSGAFQSVEIKEAYQDDTVKDMQVFIYTLICEKKPTSQQQAESDDCKKLLAAQK